ncbi:MAG: Lar family restriction alleviation protein [Oscillospiraceae bacterium]|nr:Lar family restriction alleviation protein [Oscillospiraceae bacterium]
MKANAALKPCPFCGFERPFIHAVAYDRCINIISCPKCHIEITVPTFMAGKRSNNKERVILAWNRRADNG